MRLVRPHDIMGLSANPLSLREQLAFYGAYHTNNVNVFIHIICVPLIYMSILSLLLTTGFSLDNVARQLPQFAQTPLHELSTFLAKHVPNSVYQHLNLASFLSVVYLAYYAVLDVAAATLLSPLWAAYYFVSWALIEYHPKGQQIALGVFLFGWIAQFYGHGVHEGRAPALLDNLLGALVLAPLFVFLEVLFFFGYRPELQKWLKNETGRLITQFRTEQASKQRAEAAKSK